MVRRGFAIRSSPGPLAATAGVANRLVSLVGPLGPRVLAMGVVVAGCLVIALASGLVRSPFVPGGLTTASSSPTVSAVLGYALTDRGPAIDPAVRLASGQSVKASNYRGVPIGGTTYYYNLAPRPSFDPLARGVVSPDRIDVVAVVGDPPNRVVIYTIKP